MVGVIGNERMKRAIFEQAGLDPDVDYSEEATVTPTVSGGTQVVEGPLVPDETPDYGQEAQDLYGQAANNPDGFLVAMANRGIDIDPLRKVASPQEWVLLMEKNLTKEAVEQARVGSKAAKQEGITPAALTSSPGGPVGVPGAESLTDELSEILAGKHGSLVSARNVKRRQEITAQLNEIEPMVSTE